MSDCNEAATPASDLSGSGSSSHKSARKMTRLWLKVAGWMVTGLGFLTVINAMRFWRVHEWPFLVAVGLVLMGASYSLAGMALSEARGWPIPLAILSCFTYAFFPPYGVGILLTLGISVLCISAASEESFDYGVSNNAQLAFGLWLGGLALMLLYWAMTF